MESYGIPRKIIHMIKMLYEDSEGVMLDKCEESEWFKVKTRVKQGDVISGFIFLMIVDWIMRNTTAGNKTDKMELHDKTRGPGLCRWHSIHVIMIHTHTNKDKTTESICSKDRTKNKLKENSSI